MRSQRPAGAVLELRAEEVEAMREAFPATTHVFGVAQGLGIARRLGWLPREVTVLGVEGACFDHGAPLSAAVAAAIPEVTERAARRLAAGG